MSARAHRQSSPARALGSPTARNTPSSNRGWYLAAAVLIAATIIAYLPATRGDFIWDDDDYVSKNPTLRSLDGLYRIWFEIGATPQYYPLVHTGFWIEYHLWGLNPAGYHVVNILLHALGAVLLWRLLLFLDVPGAWLAAAVFALHPVHVESVAWITERKNVLSGVFYFASALVYLRLVLAAQPIDVRTWRIRYAAALLLYVCALLSKTVTCSLPAALLLVIWWKRSRLTWADARLLIPFFEFGVAAGWLTATLEKFHVGAVGEEWSLPLVGHLLLAGRVPWFYAGKLVWPAALSFVYPRWTIDPHAWWQYLFPAATLLLPAVLFVGRRRVGRGPLAAVLFFLGTLTPALGFFSVYPMRYSFVADHFQYLAGVGPIVLIVGWIWSVTVPAARRRESEPPAEAGGRHGHGVPDACTPCPRFRLPRRFCHAPGWVWPWAKRLESSRRRLAPPAIAGLVLVTLGVLTWRQTHVYHNLDSLWRDTLAKNPDAWMAHNNFGNVLLTQGRIEEARSHYEEAIRLNDDVPQYYNNLAGVLLTLGRRTEAIVQVRKALSLDPDYAAAHCNLAIALEQEGDLRLAIQHYRQALRRQPDDLQALNNLAWILATAPDPALRDEPEAVRLAERAADQTAREDYSVLDTLAAAYAAVGRFDQAVTTAEEALVVGTQAGKTKLLTAIRARLELYRQHQPFRQDAPAP